MNSSDQENSRREHAAIEWHDSDLTAISRLPAALVLDVRAIVHRSDGDPGIDPGSVWVQPAAIVLSDGQLTGPGIALTGTIDDGQILTDCYEYNSLIRCPFTSNSRASLDLTLSSGDRLRIDSDQLSITFTGEPEFLEDFVPEWIEDDPGI